MARQAANPGNGVGGFRYLEHLLSGNMDENDHRLVMAELNALKQQVASTIHKFEATGFAVILKKNYVALHDLEHRITEMHLTYAHAIGE